jgi:ADP-ribosylglycohydrolase
MTEKQLEELCLEALIQEGVGAVVRQASAQLSDWPNLGPFDIRIGDTAVLELKWWGNSTSARFQTLWDACKVANAVAEGVVAAGYLISGGHSSIWAKDDAFVQLLGTRESETLPLCIPSANWWTSPANDETTVPERLMTTSVATTTFLLGGERHELRCARVAPMGGRVLVPKYVSAKARASDPEIRSPADVPLDIRMDRFAGVLLGGALGDSLGASVEFLSLHQIRQQFGPSGIHEPAPAFGREGAITDDTQMTLFTAEGLLRAHNRWLGKGIAHIPSVVRHAYVRWLFTQGEPEAWRAFFDEKPEPWPDGWLVSLPELRHRRAPGNTCLSGASSPRMGTVTEPLNNSKGCGAVMRAAPVGLAPVDDPFELGCEIGALTHGHPSGYLAAGAAALLVRRLVEGRALVDAVDEAIARLREQQGSEECIAALIRGRDMGKHASSAEDIEELGEGWVAEETLAIAVCCALGADDFVTGTRLAANHSGDSDSTAAIAGNLLGARVGRSGLPQNWLEKLELRAAIEQMAHDLALHHEQPEVRGPFDASMGDEDRYPGW